MKKLLISLLGLGLGFAASAHAAPMTVGGLDIDTDNAASTVLWAQGGVFAGLPANRREACLDSTDVNSTVGINGVECRATEAAGFNLDEAIELDENNTVTHDPDVLSAFFDQGPLVNGAGIDLVIFETLEQNDSPTLTLMLNGQQLFGTQLDVVVVDGDTFTVWGFDFSDLPLGMAADAVVGEPIYIQTQRDDQNTPIGSSDIAAIIGVNFGSTPPPPEVPLPAAVWLFIAGATGLGYAGRKKKKAA